MRASRSRTLWVALMVALIAGNIGLRFAVAAAERGRDAAVERRQDATYGRLSQEGIARAIFDRIAGDDAAAVRADEGQTHLTAAADTVDAGAAFLRTVLDATTAEVATAKARAEAAHVALVSNAANAEDLRRCLAGIDDAASASRRGDTAAAIWSMQSVAEQCRRARAALGSAIAGLFPYDFPDPFVLRVGDGYYAYATNSAGGAVQLLRSNDLTSWSFVGVALPSVPSWAVPGATWAPSAARLGGRYVLYYAVRQRELGRQCISAATSSTPAGPFVDSSTAPLVCELAEGGSIDPSPVVAPDGTAYLLWKSEGETAGGRAALRGSRLAPDGLSLTGATATLAVVDQAWEGRTVEGPSMAPSGRGFLLVYSANRWDSARYAVGAARCDTPLGPCRKLPGPVLSSTGTLAGPGGAEVFVDAAGRLRVAFHAWDAGAIGYPHNRFLHIGTVTDSGSSVTITVDG